MSKHNWNVHITTPERINKNLYEILIKHELNIKLKIYSRDFAPTAAGDENVLLKQESR